MTLLQTILLYFSALLIFLGLDAIWISVVGKGLYNEYLSHYLVKNPNLIAAAVFYLIFAASLLFFVIVPSIRENDLVKIFINGSIFGLVTYSSYSLTNYSILKNWPLNVAVADILWGIFATTITSVASFYIATEILNIKL